MPALQVKNVSEKLYVKLKQTVRKHHRSVSAQVLYLIERGPGARTTPYPVPDARSADEKLVSDALAPVCAHSHTAYDLFYLALVRTTGVAMPSVNPRLKSFARRHSVRLLDKPSA